MSDFDVIVVGAGPAGSVAAYQVAQSGRSVLMVERGSQAGAKNMSGGRLYTHAAARIFPDFTDRAPLERRITRERISFLSPDACTTLDYTSENLAQQGKDSYSVLRATFDPWLAGEAETAGAEVICGISVDRLLMEGQRVQGIVADGDEITGEVVILADGANSLLAGQAVGAVKPALHHMAVGIKQVIELPPAAIEDRFLTGPDEGGAWLFAGDATKGVVGGGFVYTNRNSLSVGLVATLSELTQGTTSITRMLEDFKAHPAVAPLVAGGRVVEHSGHLVPEGGLAMVPELTGDGVLVAGDAAGFVVNAGYTVRGMDFAMESGLQAANAALAALEAADTSKAGLASYRQRIEDSFVMRDLQFYQKFPHFMESTPGMFTTYPKAAGTLLDGLFTVDGAPLTKVGKRAWRTLRSLGVATVAKDAWKAVKAL